MEGSDDTVNATDHGPRRSNGGAHLVKATGGHAQRGTPEAEGVVERYPLNGDVTTVGSSEARDITLPGMEPEHGEIVRLADSGEHVYRQHSPSGVSHINGALATVADLHHGTRLTLGDCTLVYQIDEFTEDAPTASQEVPTTSHDLPPVNDPPLKPPVPDARPVSARLSLTAAAIAVAAAGLLLLARRYRRRNRPE